MFGALAEVCVLDPKFKSTAGRVGKTASELLAAGYTAEQVLAFKDWWSAFDWRGQRGDTPTPARVVELIKQSVTPRVVITRPSPTPERSKQNGSYQSNPQPNHNPANAAAGVDAEDIARYKARYG
jgi:hypothetical protein